ncbi:hypothetical protein ID858_02505, partial [Xenorhabdus sp. DI]|nr:hypothetical protein [Xenorhabdus sp. DI]
GDLAERRTRETRWALHVAELNTRRVPGNHMTMLSAPQVGQWIAQLWQELDCMRNPK